jgi:hypothetical protein
MRPPQKSTVVDLIQVYGDELAFDSAAALLKALKTAHRSMVEDVEALAEEHRFFHWELEFPEVFFGPKPGAERQVERKPVDCMGFDAIIGNPPYVRQETLKSDKSYFMAAFPETYESTCDLYVYFMDRELKLLRPEGRMAMIVANKWLRAAYGRRLRQFLLHHARPESIVDFGHSPIFPDADTFPCVPVFSRRPVSIRNGESLKGDEAFHACEVPRRNYQPGMPLTPYIQAHQHAVPTRMLRGDRVQ